MNASKPAVLAAFAAASLILASCGGPAATPAAPRSPEPVPAAENPVVETWTGTVVSFGDGILSLSSGTGAARTLSVPETAPAYRTGRADIASFAGRPAFAKLAVANGAAAFAQVSDKPFPAAAGEKSGRLLAYLPGPASGSGEILLESSGKAEKIPLGVGFSAWYSGRCEPSAAMPGDAATVTVSRVGSAATALELRLSQSAPNNP